MIRKPLLRGCSARSFHSRRAAWMRADTWCSPTASVQYSCTAPPRDLRREPQDAADDAVGAEHVPGRHRLPEQERGGDQAEQRDQGQRDAGAADRDAPNGVVVEQEAGGEAERSD